MSPEDTVHSKSDELLRLAASLRALFEDIHRLAPNEDRNSLSELLEAHLTHSPRDLPVVSHELPEYQLVDVQIALEIWPTIDVGRHSEIVGISGQQRRFHPLSELVSGEVPGVGVGPIDYIDMADAPESTRSCVRFGMFLLREGDRRCAVLLRGGDPHGPMQSAGLEILAQDCSFASDVLTELRALSTQHSVLRGQVLALGPGEGQHYGALRFMKRPTVERQQLVLPETVLDQIERHVIGIAEHGERLRAAGQHLKRGVLLYGPPGTGKTHTVRYLLSQLPAMTAFVLSGQALQLIGQACGLARLLQPSIVILEDVDLIAGDRSFGPMGPNPLLFEVLNQIDGLGDDVDVAFLLTTNRVDILERALAERPGRVDAAVEIAPPDVDGRMKLFRLYGAGVGIDVLPDEDLTGAVAATDGKTATYLREVVRRAALKVAEREPEGSLQVDGETLASAASDLLDDRAALTRSLLGGPEEPDAEPPISDPGFSLGAGGFRMMRMMQRRGGNPAPFGSDP